MRTRALALLVALLVARPSLAQPAGAAPAPPPPAAAPTAEDTERARTFFNAGAQAYAAGKYGDAVRSFEQAYAIAPRPPVLFSLAQAERKQFLEHGDPAVLRAGITHYAEYLERVPTGGRRSEAQEAKAELEARLAKLDPTDRARATAPSGTLRKPRVTVFSPTPGAQVSIDGSAPSELPYFADLEPGKHRVRVFGEGYFDAEQEISSGERGLDVPVNLALRERPAQVTIALATSAEVYVDGRLVAETPIGRPIEVPSGPHVIAIAKNGSRPWSQEVVLERAKPITIEPRLTTSGQRILAYTMLGAGGASLVVGAVFTLTALASQSRVRDLEEKRTTQNLGVGELDEHNRLLERRDSDRNAAIFFATAGGVVATGGALFYFLDRPPIALLPPRSVEPTPQPGSPVDVATYPILGPGMYGAGLTGRF